MSEWVYEMLSKGKSVSLTERFVDIDKLPKIHYFSDQNSTMFKNFPIPPSFSLIKKGKIFLLIKEEYKDFLLREGIEDLKNFLKKHEQTTRYFGGRTPHPSIPIRDGKRMVVRSYSHGGLLRAFTRNLYLFGSRSFQELALTEEIRSSGISTIEPIAAPPLPLGWGRGGRG